MVQEALLNWQSLGSLILHEDGRIQLLAELPEGVTPTPSSEVAYDRMPIAPPPETAPPRISILSLFAGMGTDRLAMERILRQSGKRDRMGPSWFVESDQPLREAVGQLWEQGRAADPTIAPYTPLCDDVWDLVNPAHPAAGTLAREIPGGSLLLIVAGSPCQGLTRGGPTGGRAGVASTASSPIVAVFATWHILRTLRPDLEIHVVIENAGSMTGESRTWILEALNIHPNQAPTTDAADWSGFQRRRTFFSTLPTTPDLAIRTRPTPWDPGWGRRHRTPLPPMQRSRGPGPRASTYQYMTQHLLYRLEGA